MIRSAIVSLGLAGFALSLVGCGGGSSAPAISQEEKDKKKEEMMKNAKNMQGKPAPQ